MDSRREKVTSYVCQLDCDQIDRLRAILHDKGWEFKQQPYAHWQAKFNKTTVSAYQSGKVTIQGKDTEELVLFIIEPRISGQAQLGYEKELSTQSQNDAGPFVPHAGIDESGKGDFFGPLVIAAAFVCDGQDLQLLKAGVKDSKAIKSDKKISLTATSIRNILKGKYAVVPIGPEAYNRLYASFGNLNRLLAWGHSRALENLLEKVPECREAIADKFGNENLIKQALMKNGRNINLIQRTKGEQDIAVAAASILARDEFVRRLTKLGEDIGVKLPKGAGSNVLESSGRIYADSGPNIFNHIAKTHFRTMEKVLSKDKI